MTTISLDELPGPACFKPPTKRKCSNGMPNAARVDRSRSTLPASSTFDVQAKDFFVVSLQRRAGPPTYGACLFVENQWPTVGMLT